MAPLPALGDVVESIWIQDSGTAVARRAPTCVLPTGTVEVLFHFGDPLVHVEDGREIPVPRFYITGQRTRPVFTRATGRTAIVIVSLLPCGSGALLPGASEIVDGYTDLAEFVPASALARLHGQLATASSDGRRLQIVQEFLIRVRWNRPGDERMVVAARQIAAGSQHCVSGLASSLGMTRRHFARSFRASLGLRPKTFARIMRFQRALGLRRSLELPWADIAVRCGYADQPHMIRDVREFSSRTPSELGLHRQAAHQVFNGAEASGYFDTVYL